MAKKSLEKLTRQSRGLSSKNLFVLACEGSKTELEYFFMFKEMDNITIKHLKKRGTHSDPKHVLDTMKKYLKTESLKENDEAWLIVDKDQWPDKQLSELHRWAQEKNNQNLALSNPCFEYWLLLHFDKGKGIDNSRQCSEKLKMHLPDYTKKIDASKFTKEGIRKAIERARSQNIPPCCDWPKKTGTTVYKLVEKIH